MHLKNPALLRGVLLAFVSYLMTLTLMMPSMQAGDVPVTYADSEALERDYGFRPQIGIREGLRNFAEWYKGYYK